MNARTLGRASWVAGSHSACAVAAVILALVAFAGCSKDADEEPPPPIADYRTYDWVPVSVKDAGDEGFAVLCKISPIERRTGYIQLLAAGGGEGARLDLNVLPTRIEDIEFLPEDLLYTDFVQRDGTYIIVGTGRQTDLDNRLHLVVQVTDRNGTSIAEPFRRFLTGGSEIVTNDASDADKDLNGLPRLRALCDTYGEALVVAARWETATAAGVRLFRFPLHAGSVPDAWKDIPLDGPADRLLHMACDKTNGRTIIVTDADGPASGTKVWGFTPTTNGWDLEGEEGHNLAGEGRIDPQQLSFAGNRFLMVGNQVVSGTDRIQPFVSRFDHAGAASDAIHPVSGIVSDALPVASYCAGTWDSGTHLLAQVHEGSALVPYFDGDITSDLELVDLDGSDNKIGEPMEIILGQGLRAMGAFDKAGEHIVIGSQHPFLNAGYQHTFYLVLK